MSNTPVPPLLHAWHNLLFIWDNADTGKVVPPTLLIAVALLAWPKLRRSLKDHWALAGYLALPFLWIALVPWGATFLDAMDGGHESPPWASWVVGAVFLGWPVVALALIVRARNARIPHLIFVACNIPGWLLTSFVAAMAVSGDWI